MAGTVAAPLERRLGGIARVTDLTSTSSLGLTNIVVQFDLDRSIDAAARDVQAALNAAAADLLAGMPSRPAFRKANPAAAPILILALTSTTLSSGALYDVADTVVAQRISQVPGVAGVGVNGADQPAVRVRLDPMALAAMGVSLEDVRCAIVQASAVGPLGRFDGTHTAETIGLNGALRTARDYRQVVVKEKHGTIVRLASVASIVAGPRNSRSIAWYNRDPAVLLFVFKQADANALATADRVKALLPALAPWIPAATDVAILFDQTRSVRTGMLDMQLGVGASVVLVMAVVLAFLRRGAPALAAGVAVPISLAATFAAMWRLGFSLNTFTLMAVAVAVAFVVDDAIVVVEGAIRNVEAGLRPPRAALLASRQIAFTIVAMSVSLLAAFIPLVFMGGVVGRYLREFSLTLAVAVVASLLVALTVTPTICAHARRRRARSAPAATGEGGPAAAPRAPSCTHLSSCREPGRSSSPVAVATGEGTARSAVEEAWRRHRLRTGASPGSPSTILRMVPCTPLRGGGWGGAFEMVLRFYDRSLRRALARRGIMLAAFAAISALALGLYVRLPKGLVPEDDSDLIFGIVAAATDASYQAMVDLQQQVDRIVMADPAVAGTGSTLGGLFGSSSNNGRMFISLRPVSERRASAQQVAERLRKRLALPGVRVFLYPVQQVHVGGGKGPSRYQLTVWGADFAELQAWVPRVAAAVRRTAGVTDVSTDREAAGLQTNVVIDRTAAARLGVRIQDIDDALNDAFAQRQIATIYTERNQYRVVLEIDPRFQQDPADLGRLYVHGAEDGRGAAGRQGRMVPLSAVARFVRGRGPLSVSHQGQFPSAKISFDLAPGVAPGSALARITQELAALHLPDSLHADFAGEALALTASASRQPFLILAAIAAVYIVLGVLYESLVHPLTILSTLPSTGLGALLALRLFGLELSVVALIGIVLLVGVVMKNGIILVDFALEREARGLSPVRAIHAACLARLRPILMTGMAAICGALPLLVVAGPGAALRRPLAVTIIGGLMLSQVLTLYTTPVVYLALGRFGRARRRGRARSRRASAGGPGPRDLESGAA